MTGRDDHRALQERMHSCRVSGSYLLGMKCTFPRKEVRIKHGMLHQRRSARRKMTRIVRIDNHQLVGRLLIDVGVPHASLPRRSPTMSSSWPTTNCRTGLETAFDNAEGRWTLARLTGAVIDPDRSLAEVGRWIDEVSSCSRSSQRACAPAVSARDDRVRHHRSARM